ncbi:hypothetical protein [Halogranum rubrum]|uniref:Uncharacterized protein n=1 Tax=Halogranum salarium B-1 TaxID=1210908 RepID=J3JHJ7_9EURY|nr:hypothetical protein [Halogranum salarium]EJN61041.1 hypothetical protein HSB1_00820 [Halogranum salarium B-1]
MGDTKRGRVEQARNEVRRQYRRDMEEAVSRGDEGEPADLDTAEDIDLDYDESDAPRECHRRGCEESAAFSVLERYIEETTQSPVEAVALLCAEHTEEEGPTRLEAAYDDYVFRIEPLPERES